MQEKSAFGTNLCGPSHSVTCRHSVTCDAGGIVTVTRHTTLKGVTRCDAPHFGGLRDGENGRKKGDSMSSVNKVILVGNLGKDPEIRHTRDGRPIANLSVYDPLCRYRSGGIRTWVCARGSQRNRKCHGGCSRNIGSHSARPRPKDQQQDDTTPWWVRRPNGK